MTIKKFSSIKESLKILILLALVLCFVSAHAENKIGKSSIKIIERPAPKYPTMALINKTEGWVKVVFTIDEKGNVVDPAVVDAQPRKVFDIAAFEAVKKFKFKPIIQNGKAVPMRVSQTIEFNLPQDAKNTETKAKDNNKPITVADIIKNIKEGKQFLHDDIVMLVKSIEAKSTTKTHKRSHLEFEIEMLPDNKGYPATTKLIKNTYGKKLNANKIEQLKALGLKQAQMAYDLYHGYYNPIFKISHAKTQPARIIPTIEAKSMPLPEYSKELTFKSKVTINEKGIPVKALNTTMEGQPVTQELALIFLEQFSFFHAMKKKRPVEDELDLTVKFAVVQISDIESIRTSYFKN